MKDELVIGRIRTAHGVRGELKVDPLSGETDHFKTLGQVTLVRGSERRVVTVESVRIAHRTVLLKLQGMDTPEVAKRWRGWSLVVDRRDAAPLDDEEYYFADLIGLNVVVEGQTRGRVADIWEGGPAVLLGIDVNEGGQRLVPFQPELIGQIDLVGGTLEVLNPEVLD